MHWYCFEYPYLYLIKSFQQVHLLIIYRNTRPYISQTFLSGRQLMGTDKTKTNGLGMEAMINKLLILLIF